MKLFISAFLFVVLLISSMRLTVLWDIYVYVEVFILFILVLMSLAVTRLFYGFLENQESGFLPPKRRNGAFAVFVIIGSCIFMYNYWASNKAITLTEALDIEKQPLISVHAYVNQGPGQSVVLKDEDFLEELHEVFDNYKVKKVKFKEWQTKESRDGIAFNGQRPDDGNVFFI
ncbi:hypothetical protein EDD68_1033 [Melghiribacillus thermohalophilus]|uniref:Uncharacterized protein n=1 Tax=Melghiribacillus thermohalophilus TaxID=1324956 RepID=A0A4R3N812_9BACI|nr:hypothetical protein [Melghiribacillus thermohalophilus]TCT25451.1 hypothetical protein EDD68_1033 [Melghiribacillus thermohalophilus]